MPNDLLDDLLQNATEEEEQVVEVARQENEILQPLLKEIDSIEDDAIRQFVRSVLLKSDVFWEIPSSFNGERPPDELGVGGNVLHTQRVARIIKIMAEAEAREQYDVDILVAAALIHDITKGIEWGDIVTFDPMHPYTIDSYVKDAIEQDGEHIDEPGRSSTLYLDDPGIAHILRIARCHLGFWPPIPETFPISTPDWLLHWADLLATKLHVIIDGDQIKAERWAAVEPTIPQEVISDQESDAASS